MEVLTVAELIAELQKLPQDAVVVPVVGWAADTAYADKGAGIAVKHDAEEGTVLLEGWLSNCGTELEIGGDDDEDSNG